MCQDRAKEADAEVAYFIFFIFLREPDSGQVLPADAEGWGVR